MRRVPPSPSVERHLGQLGMREFLIGEEAKSLAELTEVTFD